MGTGAASTPVPSGNLLNRAIGVKINAALVNYLPADENAAGQNREAKPNMLRTGHHRMPVAE